MPGYKTHLMGGFIAFSMVVVFIGAVYGPVSTLFEWMCCAFLGSLFPDIDIKSKGQQLFFRILAIAFIILLWRKRITDIAIMSTIALAPLTVKHRGITHSISFLAALCFIILALVSCIASSYLRIVFFDLLFFFAGAFSHIFLDFGPRKLLTRK